MQMVNDCEFLSLLLRIVHGSDVGKETEFQLRIIVKKGEQLQVQILWNAEREQSIRFGEVRISIPEFFDDALLDEVV